MDANDVKVFGVLGAGQMGAGIAQVAAQAGLSVKLCDVSLAVAEKAKAGILAQLGRQVDKGKLDAATRDATGARIEPIGDKAGFAPCDVVVEAATENTTLKLELLRGVDAVLREGALLATNTSSISITKLAAVTSRPTAFIGMHFMNPVPVMKLVEIVKGTATSPETVELTRALAARFGKTVITSNDHPGFLVNRVLIPFLNEACLAYQDGVGSIEDLDQGAKLGLNHPMGPFELADLIGLDTVLAIAEVLQTQIGGDKYAPAVVLRNLVAAGWLGKKTKRGFYAYDDKGQRGAASLSR
ncbi:MAG: 3-hydroxybutyryl-CoA dehydrogenase [Polyangiaceae bacterium]|nr:3-hydroxybutyryl-CoA dehydrogenase [Polyangiaceae bacterium]